MPNATKSLSKLRANNRIIEQLKLAHCAPGNFFNINAHNRHEEQPTKGKMEWNEMNKNTLQTQFQFQYIRIHIHIYIHNIYTYTICTLVRNIYFCFELNEYKQEWLQMRKLLLFNDSWITGPYQSRCTENINVFSIIIVILLLLLLLLYFSIYTMYYQS